MPLGILGVTMGSLRLAGGIISKRTLSKASRENSSTGKLPLSIHNVFLNPLCAIRVIHSIHNPMPFRNLNGSIPRYCAKR